MDKERWQVVKDLVAGAMAVPEEEQAAWLRRACGDDVSLFDEAWGYLITQEPATADLVPEAPVSELLAEDLSGHKVGIWRLVRELGRGGMGSVWLAERDDGELRMKAAIKLISRKAASPEWLTRFRRERQILADLNHPAIAALHDGGTTEDGRPYLVMEYIEGEHIDLWCDKRQLSKAERLNLFREVCEAVGHAHERGIIHRDLKPANIMVTGTGHPKLLDFRVAINHHSSRFQIFTLYALI